MNEEIKELKDRLEKEFGKLDEKRGHVPVYDEIIEIDIDDIQMSPENELLYKPIDPYDSKVIELSESIEEHGVLEPIVLTLDYYIVSGHRRYVASKEIFNDTIPARFIDYYHDDPNLEKLLIEFNNQRVKSFDEILRESVVKISKEEAHKELIDYRVKKSNVIHDLKTIGLRELKERSKISSAKDDFLYHIKKVIDEDLEDYHPLSDRQIHYALLNYQFLKHTKKPDSVYKNDLASYKSLCDLLTRARLEEIISFYCISDSTRPTASSFGSGSVDGFFRRNYEYFLKGYHRDYLQSQPNKIEIIGEKLTIKSIIGRVSREYCVPYMIGRGFSSLDPRYNMFQRFQESGKEKLILLFLSDFDPEGEEIAHSFGRSMRDDFGIENIELIKVAITEAQIKEYKLPAMMKAKKKSSNYKKFNEKYGDDVFELEALKPNILEEILENAVKSVIDIDLFNMEIEKEKEESLEIAEKRGLILNVLKNIKH